MGSTAVSKTLGRWEPQAVKVNKWPGGRRDCLLTAATLPNRLRIFNTIKLDHQCHRNLQYKTKPRNSPILREMYFEYKVRNAYKTYLRRPKKIVWSVTSGSHFTPKADL